jgi:hypothetical protein
LNGLKNKGRPAYMAGHCDERQAECEPHQRQLAKRAGRRRGGIPGAVTWLTAWTPLNPFLVSRGLPAAGIPDSFLPWR